MCYILNTNMEQNIQSFIDRMEAALQSLPREEIQKATEILHETYRRDGRIFVFGNGGSFSIATHWAADFNKTVFSKFLDRDVRRFQAIRLPGTDAELTAWANDVGYHMVFAGPLKNHIRPGDAIIAISSSGNSENIIKAVELARAHNAPVIGLSGFDGGKLNELADAKIFVRTPKGQYGVVESVHAAILHFLTEYFGNFFENDLA